MARKTQHVTAAELRIMKILWKMGSATVRQCLDALSPGGGDPPAYWERYTRTRLPMAPIWRLFAHGYLDLRLFFSTPFCGKGDLELVGAVF